MATKKTAVKKAAKKTPTKKLGRPSKKDKQKEIVDLDITESWNNITERAITGLRKEKDEALALVNELHAKLNENSDLLAKLHKDNENLIRAYKDVSDRSHNAARQTPANHYVININLPK